MKLFTSLLLVVMLAALFGCAKSQQFGLMTPQPASTQPTTQTLVNAQADTREIGKTLSASSANVQTIAAEVRADAKAAPEPVRAALEGRADRLVHESAAVKAQAGLVDPGITRQLDAAMKQMETMQAENEKIVAGLVAQNATTEAKLAETEKQLADAESMRFWIPFLFGGIILGCVMMAMKFHPAFASVPLEAGYGLIGGCLLILVYIHTQGKYPVPCAIGAVIFVVSLIAPTVWRQNTKPKVTA
jgi:hypothetical protein